MSSGVGCRYGLDPMLLWLWGRAAAAAPIQPLAWEPHYAMGAALKSKNIIITIIIKKSGISLDYLGKIEVNINKPGLKTLLKISNALNLPLKKLFDFKEV